jgi:hypothetical protein
MAAITYFHRHSVSRTIIRRRQESKQVSYYHEIPYIRPIIIMKPSTLSNILSFLFFLPSVFSSPVGRDVPLSPHTNLTIPQEDLAAPASPHFVAYWDYDVRTLYNFQSKRLLTLIFIDCQRTNNPSVPVQYQRLQCTVSGSIL